MGSYATLFEELCTTGTMNFACCAKMLGLLEWGVIQKNWGLMQIRDLS